MATPTWAQDQQAEAAARARAAATASAAAAAAKANKEGLVHKIISLVGALIGVDDAVNCFTKGDVMGCISTALNFVPWGKIFKAIKVGFEALKVWRAIEHAEEAVRAAEDIEHAATAAEDAARAEAEAAKAEAAAAKEGSTASCAAHSFLAGTQVLLADGTTKNIQDIRPGDAVLATDPQSGVSHAETVLALITTTTDHDFTQITLATTGHGAHAPPASKGHAANAAKPAAARITTTWHHPFWDQTLHRWTNASELAPGSHLRQTNGATIAVAAVENYHATAVTYDLTVASLHTYYVVAGQAPVLVHNDDAACPIGLHPKGKCTCPPEVKNRMDGISEAVDGVRKGIDELVHTHQGVFHDVAGPMGASDAPFHDPVSVGLVGIAAVFRVTVPLIRAGVKRSFTRGEELD